MKKRIVPLLLASALLISTAACSGNTGDSSTNDSTNSGNSSTGGSATEIDTSEHVTISYLTLGDIPTNETERALAAVNEILTERGVALPLPGQATTTMEDRLEKGAAAQAEIFGEQTAILAQGNRRGNKKDIRRIVPSFGKKGPVLRPVIVQRRGPRAGGKTEQQRQQKAAQGNMAVCEGGILHFFHGCRRLCRLGDTDTNWVTYDNG